MTPIERARKYLEKCEPAISGSGGHNQTFFVASQLVHGFALSEPDALMLLTEYNRHCSPAWSESELRHKVQSAAKANHAKARGHLLGSRSIKHVYQGALNSGREQCKPSPNRLTASETIAASRSDIGAQSFGKIEQLKSAQYNIKAATALPQPMADATRAFLKAAFLPGEGIGIAQEVLNEEQKGIPKGHGVVLSLEEWLKKLDAHDGDINKIFSSSDKTGAFVRINPTKFGGSKDSDITAFRHALLEFDKLSIDEQWNLIQQSNIPCTAVIFSGGKSIHAWVKIDASDRKQFDERVAILYNHFDDYIAKDESGKVLDRVKANKNPSRLSRLPGMLRGKFKQDLLALNCGSESFSTWQMANEKSDLQKPLDLFALYTFQKSDDKDVLLGDRYLSKGGSMVLIAQSGVGKSAMLMQMAICFAESRSWFGVNPSRPLKSLIVQAENDFGDMAEMFQGSVKGLGLTSDVAPIEDQAAVVKRLVNRIVIVPDSTHTSDAFAAHLLRLVDEYKPDIVMADPMLSFIGDDMNSQKACSHFFRELMNPIAQSTGVAFIWFHHTGKPAKDARERKNWTANDYGYIGAGSAELTNFARATCYLKQASKDDESLFELIFAKRGKRAGATDLQGNKTQRVWMRHSDKGICWIQENPPAEDEGEKKESKSGGKPKSSFDYESFISSIQHEHFSAAKLVERMVKFSGLSERTIYAKHLPELKKSLKFDQEMESFSA